MAILNSSFFTMYLSISTHSNQRQLLHKIGQIQVTSCPRGTQSCIHHHCQNELKQICSNDHKQLVYFISICWQPKWLYVMSMLELIYQTWKDKIHQIQLLPSIVTTSLHSTNTYFGFHLQNSNNHKHKHIFQSSRCSNVSMFRIRNLQFMFLWWNSRQLAYFSQHDFHALVTQPQFTTRHDYGS